MLSARLATLAEEGIVERRRYSEHPERFEYVLTEKGRDLQPVILALVAWGDRYTARPRGAGAGDRPRGLRPRFHMVPTCSECGEEVEHAERSQPSRARAPPRSSGPATRGPASGAKPAAPPPDLATPSPGIRVGVRAGSQ